MKRLMPFYKTAGEYSYKKLINLSDDEFLDKLSNAEAMAGAFFNFTDEGKQEIISRIKKLTDDKFIESLDNNQKKAFYSILRDVGEKIDEPAIKIVEWLKKHNKTTKNEIENYVSEFDMSFDDILPMLKDAKKDGLIKANDYNVIKRVLQEL